MSLPRLPPALEGRYRVRRRLGEGGFGAVVAAEDLRLGRGVAIKLLHRPESREGLQRFLREARVTADLDHPHVVRVFDVGADGPHAWIVYEEVGGGDLGARLAGSPQPTRHEVLRWGAQVADALAAAHRAGVLHRDVKPGNILLHEDGRAALADFGVAQAEDRGLRTATGVFFGTPGYLAPEVLLGKDQGPAADQFALAVTLQVGLGGAAPYPFDDLGEVLRRISAEAPPPAPAAPPLAIALATRPEDRYPDLAAFRDALEELLAEEHGDPTLVPAREAGDAETVAAEVPSRSAGGLSAGPAASTRTHTRTSAPPSRVAPGAGRPLGIAAAAGAAVIGIAALLVGPWSPSPAAVDVTPRPPSPEPAGDLVRPPPPDQVAVRAGDPRLIDAGDPPPTPGVPSDLDPARALLTLEASTLELARWSRGVDARRHDLEAAPQSGEDPRPLGALARDPGRAHALAILEGTFEPLWDRHLATILAASRALPRRPEGRRRQFTFEDAIRPRLHRLTSSIRQLSKLGPTSLLSGAVPPEQVARATRLEGRLTARAQAFAGAVLAAPPGTLNPWATMALAELEPLLTTPDVAALADRLEPNHPSLRGYPDQRILAFLRPLHRLAREDTGRCPALRSLASRCVRLLSERGPQLGPRTEVTLTTRLVRAAVRIRPRCGVSPQELEAILALARRAATRARAAGEHEDVERARGRLQELEATLSEGPEARVLRALARQLGRPPSPED